MDAKEKSSSFKSSQNWPRRVLKKFFKAKNNKRNNILCSKVLLGILYALWLNVLMTSCQSEIPIRALVPSSWFASHANVELFSLAQEATQAENALIVENGTHAEEANADDSTVMQFLFLPASKNPIFSQFWTIFFLPSITDCFSFDAFQSPRLLIHFCLAWVWHLASQCVER